MPKSPWSSLHIYLAQANIPGLQTSEHDCRQMEVLLTAFNNLHSMSYDDPRATPVTLGLPLAIQQPSLLYAYAACGAAALARSDARWEQVGLAHYARATGLIRQTIDQIDEQQVLAENHEWILASMNALHIFEVSLFAVAKLLGCLFMGH
jgi:hypothetical protein